MSPNLRIAIRFLVARKRSMIMSLTGISFGVGFFIVALALTTGFEGFFIRTILGTDGAIRIEDRIQDTLRWLEAGENSSFVIANRESRKYVGGIDEPKLMREALAEFPNVSAVSGVVRGNVRAETVARTDGAQVFGINLDDHLGASDLGRQIILGSLEDFRDTTIGTLIGRTLARRLDVTVGDMITLVAEGERQRFRICAIYETGVTEIDKLRIYVHISEARALLKKPFGATFIQINVFDRDRATEDANRMEDVLHHGVRSWQEREVAWLGVFSALRVLSASMVSTIILISGLGMFNTLAMIVLEKTREISILRSMGYTRRDISRIFLLQGGIVLAVGTLTGWLLGAFITWGMDRIPINITGIFRTETYVVAWSFTHYLYAAATAFVIVMIASLIPARRAARLEPGDVIRGTAT